MLSGSSCFEGKKYYPLSQNFYLSRNMIYSSYFVYKNKAVSTDCNNGTLLSDYRGLNNVL